MRLTVEKVDLAVQEPPKEKVCPLCFELNEAGAAFCSLCGGSLGDSKAPSEGSDQEVYKELAETNLLRMRGQYKEAVQVCLGILKRYPHNATAHTLLGDIYQEQGDLKQAAEWYEMALDLTPGAEAEVKKLHDVRARMEAETHQNAIEQLGIQEHRRPNFGLFAAGLLAIAVVVGGGGFWFGSVLSQRSTEKAEEPKIKRTEVGIRATDPPKENAPDKPVEPPVTTPTIQPSAHSDRDMSLLNTLRGQTEIGRSILDATMDPRGPSATITILAMDGLSSEQSAVLAASAAFQVESGLTFVVVRVLKGAELALIADVNREDYDKASQAGGSLVDKSAEILTNIWPAATTPQT